MIKEEEVTMNVMKKAWEIARKGVKKFGGKVKEYFAEALRMAWVIVKKCMEKVQLKGSEKQVKWAEDIREEVASVFERAKKNFVIMYGKKWELDHGFREKQQQTMKVIEENILKNDSAEYFIRKFRSEVCGQLCEEASRLAKEQGVSNIFARRIGNFGHEDFSIDSLSAQMQEAYEKNQNYGG